MRILMVTDFYHPFLGGVEKHVRSLSVGLVERGHHVAVATLGRDGLPDFEVDQGVSVYRVHGTAQRLDRLFSNADRPWAPPFPDPELTRSLRKVVSQERPDVVHGHDWLIRSYLPLRPRSDARLAVSLHYYTLNCAKKSLMYNGVPCSGPGPSKCARCAAAHYGAAKSVVTLTGNWAGAALERSAADIYLPVSYATALGNELVGSDLPFQVIPNFIPTNPGLPGDDLDTYMEQLPDEPFLLFVGDLRRDKGLHVLLEAHAKIGNAPPLVLIGKVWPETPTTFPDNVVVLKHWPNYAVMEAWRRSLIALVPSIWPEPCATVVLEAMAGGRPVIATNIGGNPEMVADGETGILVTPEDPDALRAAIAHLLSDPARIEQMGQAGQRHVRAFQSDAVITKIERVYEDIVERRAPAETAERREQHVPAVKPVAGRTMSGDPAEARTRPPMRVSVVINNYNYGRFVGDAIESALDQTYEQTEVIVVDDGSTDNSREVILGYGDRINPVLKANGGQASAFNAGFARSQGDIVIFLDADDMLLPHVTAEVARVFEANPGIAKVQYRLDLVDAAGYALGRQVPPSELPLPDGDLRQHMLHFPDDVRTPPTSGNAFAAEMLRQILPMPEAPFGATGADLYLYNLAPLYGPVKSLPESGGRYRVHGANYYYSAGLSTDQMRQMITCSTASHEYLIRYANELRLANTPRSGAEVLSVTFLVNRLASFKLDPERHPIKGDSTIKLAKLGIVASWRRIDVPARTRLMYMLWFVTAAGSPKPLMRWLVMTVFHVERRGLLSKLV